MVVPSELFDVTPDLATFGKGLANGFPSPPSPDAPISWQKWRKYSFSLLWAEKPCLSQQPSQLSTNYALIMSLIDWQRPVMRLARDSILDRKTRCRILCRYLRHPSWSFLNLSDTGDYSSLDIKTLFMQEMHHQGILTVGTHNVSFAHNEEDVTRLLDAYDSVLPVLVDAVKSCDLFERLRCQPLVPLFKVR